MIEFSKGTKSGTNSHTHFDFDGDGFAEYTEWISDTQGLLVWDRNQNGVIDDGKEKRRFSLNRPYRGLYIPRGLWRTLDNFSGGSVALVLTSERFSEADYVRDYDTFIKLCKDGRAD